MGKRDWSRLLLGIAALLSLTVCRPVTEEVTSTPVPTPVTLEATAVIVSIPPTPEPTSIPTNTPPPKPTPAPTSPVPAGWQTVGSETSGLTLALPPDWVDSSRQVDTTSAVTRLGLIGLLLADSERSSSGLLASKDVAGGAFIITLTPDLVEADPIASLQQLTAGLGEDVTVINPSTTVNATGAAAASVEVIGDPAGLLAGESQPWRTRLLYLSLPAESSSGETIPLLLLFTAPAAYWADYAPMFDQVMKTLTVFNTERAFLVSGGRAEVSGNLENQQSASHVLNEDQNDLWLVQSGPAQYATIVLSPVDERMDVSLAVIGPDGQMLAQNDSGFAGVDEVIADLPLSPDSRYLLEVSEFFSQAGRYTISLLLSDEPLQKEAGVIHFGQSIQGELPPNVRQYWRFEGAAGQLVNIVLDPDREQLDVILDLYGPDGNRMVALDEGFSGDAEVISSFELPITGEYAIRVWAFAHNGGPYTLSLDEGVEATINFYDAGDLAYGQTREESLGAGEAHAWFFDGRRGDEITVSVTPLENDLDLDVWLLSPEIDRLAAADQFIAGEIESLSAQLSEDGQFVILVREFEGIAGGYKIQLSATPAPPPTAAGQIKYGDTVTGTLNSGEAVIWRFFGDKEDVIDINVTPSGNSDLLIWLLNPEGVRILAIDHLQAGEAESLNGFTIPVDGLWGIVIQEFYGEVSGYSLAIKRTSQ